MHYGWKQIVDAPFNEKLTLEVCNDAGDIYSLPFGCVRTENGFATEKGSHITVRPLRWRSYSQKRVSGHSRYMKSAPAPVAASHSKGNY